MLGVVMVIVIFGAMKEVHFLSPVRSRIVVLQFLTATILGP